MDRSPAPNAAERLPEILQPGRPLRRLPDGLWSVLPAGTTGHPYDTRAAAYDLLVGSRLYNRLVWGTSPGRYEAFARSAVRSAATGWLLDAGCGTLRFTAAAYRGTDRPVVVLDQSVGMLRRAQARVVRRAGRVPDNLVFLQADLLDLPFRDGTMQTVLCMGMLHLFDPADALLGGLRTLLGPGGALFLTSLAENGRFGDRYMRVLHRAGEVAAPRRSDALPALLRRALHRPVACRTEGNMVYAVAH